jgi:2-polyprenyl-6-hydroxyphenyl methylase/3-demethylubiquinone-9 3-methyltransferase
MRFRVTEKHNADSPRDEYAFSDARANPSHGYLKPAVAAFLRTLPPGSRILDLGCGNGSLIANFCSYGLELHGVDGSHSGIANARAHFREVTFHLSDLTGPIAADLPAAGFDAIISTEVIEHVFSPRKFVSNAYELLRPGGTILISTPYHSYWKNLALAITGKMDSHFTALWDHGHIKFWSRATLTKLLDEAGFQVLAFSGVGRAPGLWKSMIVRARRRS